MFFFFLVTSHVIGTDLPPILYFACIFSELATLQSSQREGTRGYFASRNNGIMDNEDLPHQYFI